jgi:hypothetical protein
LLAVTTYPPSATKPIRSSDVVECPTFVLQERGRD